MKYFGRFMLLTLGLGLFAVVLSSLPNRPAAAAGSAPVTVANTSANPGPVTRTVAAQQSGPWNVGIIGTPTVTLAAGAGVNVTNPLDVNSNPIPVVNRDVNDSALHAYQDSCFAGFNSSNLARCAFHLIPAGKRLVIQEFDARVTVDPGVKPIYLGLDTDLSTFPPARRVRHFFTLAFFASSDLDYFATHQETRLYAETPDVTGPGCQTALTANSKGGSLNCSVAGSLISIP